MLVSTGQFLQVIRGRLSPRAEDRLRERMARWAQEMAPGAAGWLGSTAGVTEDGTFVAAVRFDSEEHARANSGRPEQHRWWTETAPLFEGEVTFHDCPVVVLYQGGGSDDAGFVQIIEACVSDVEEFLRVEQRWDEITTATGFRDDILGGVVAFDGDHLVDIVYFSSEADARKGEAAELPPELVEVREREMSVLSEVVFTDLRQPWLESPA